MAMGRRKLFKFGLFFVLLVGVALLVPAYMYYTTDEPPPADDDLRVERANVPREDNGFYLVQFKEDEIWLGSKEIDDELNSEELLVDDMIFGKAWDAQLAERVLEKNKDALDRLDRALEAKVFEAPELATFDDLLPHLLGWRDLHYLVLLRARFELEAGREEGALAEAMKVVRLGQRIQASRGVIIEGLLGCAIHTAGLERVRSCLSRATVERGVLQRHLSGLLTFHAGRKAVEDSVRTEYRVAARSLEAIGRADPLSAPGGHRVPWHWPRWLAFKPNSTKRIFAEANRAILAEVARPPAERKPIDFISLSGGKLGWFPRKNSVGRLWLQQVMPGIEVFVSECVEIDLQVSFTRALIALKCHKMSKGELPPSLDALVPEYFDQVPADPYDGKPLKYSRERKILWSVGKDLVDSGGSQEAGEDERPGDDTEPVCRIEF